MSELQDALDTPIFVDIALPIEERRHQTRAVATLKDTARSAIDPDLAAMARELWGVDSDFWVDLARQGFAAALGIDPPEET